MKTDRNYKKVFAVICTLAMLFSNIIYTTSYNTVIAANSQPNQSVYNTENIVGWHSTGLNSWYYYSEQGIMKTGWLNEKGSWYYLNVKTDAAEGLMRYGWYQDGGGKWYFLNTLHDGSFGKMLTNWHWIDGYSYCFGNDGSLYQDTVTPDGYMVNKDGRWIKDFKVQYVKGKGLPSLPPSNTEKSINSSGSHTGKSYKNLNGKGQSGSDTKAKPGSDGKNNLNNSNQENPSDPAENPQNPQTGNKESGKEDKKYTVTFDFNYPNQTKTQSVSVKAGDYVQEPEPVYRDGYYFLAWYRNKDEKDLMNAFSFNDTPVNEDITLYAIWLDMKHDSDADGLVDAIETLINTDIHKADTDDDGLTDYHEYELTLTDPLNPHTYSKDIKDADFDIDNDGLTNLQEVEFGSSPIHNDKDKDYLNDGKEKEYGTDPNKPDTDNDGLIDGLEIQYGFSPTNPDTDGNGILDGKEIISVTKVYEREQGSSKPSAVIKLKAGNADNISIERDTPSESIWMPEEVPGLLDAAYDFKADGEIQEAVLTFKFDDKYVQSEDFEPAIYYVDTENQELVLLEEQSIDWNNHTVTAKTTHFSKYGLLNKNDQKKAWEQNILSSSKFDPGAIIEVVFVIDESESMLKNDSGKVRVDVTKKFIDTLRKGDRAAVIGFWTSATTYQSLTDDLEAAKESLNSIENNRGWTNLSVALEQAMKEYPVAGSDSNTKEKAMKIIVFLTDGQGSYDPKYEQMAIERGVKIYTVGLGNEYDRALLNKIALVTGGKHYHADSADELIEEFKKLISDTVDVVSDSDGDGLSDYHEERIRLFNGIIMMLNKKNADTDGDGLKDGEEIVQRTDKNGRVFFKLKSYPTRKDSDNDSVEDKEDEYPLTAKIYQIDYLGSPKHLASVEDRVDKRLKDNNIFPDYREARFESAKFGVEILMEDYYTFLTERNVDTTNKIREDYWQSSWDKYWDSYCTQFNNYMKDCKVSEEIHYFRNNLNRIPKDINELKANGSNWVLLTMEHSTYHMCPSSFSGNGLYNLKFMSKDGRNEGVYINIYGDNNNNSNKGLACTERTDPKNMGTYNFSGRYYKDGVVSVSGLNHLLLDLAPYEKYGNKSIDDLPKEGEKSGQNATRYDNDSDAKQARKTFEEGWQGIKE